jgi:hypothetical protein
LTVSGIAFHSSPVLNVESLGTSSSIKPSSRLPPILGCPNQLHNGLLRSGNFKSQLYIALYFKSVMFMNIFRNNAGLMFLPKNKTILFFLVSVLIDASISVNVAWQT